MYYLNEYVISEFVKEWADREGINAAKFLCSHASSRGPMKTNVEQEEINNQGYLHPIVYTVVIPYAIVFYSRSC